MKFQPDSFEGTNAITRQDGGAIWVNGHRHEGALLVLWRGAVSAWAAGASAAIEAAHFDALLALKPELVIFGSGARLRFPPPAILKALMARRIGFEVMDTPAACRTYNVLLAEGRAVVAALLFERGG